MKSHSLLILFLLAFGFQITANAQTPMYARVISENAYLRDAPSNSGASTEVIPEETLVKVLDEKLPWYIVRFRDRVGSMHGNTLEFVGVQAPASERTTQQTVAPDYTPVIPSTPQPRRLVRNTQSYDSGSNLYQGSTRRLLLHQRLQPEGLCRSKYV